MPNVEVDVPQLGAMSKRLEAAGKVENLTIIMKDISKRLYDGLEPDPYAALYWLRRELGYIVATLGVGVPNTKEVAERYEEYKK